MLYQVVAVRDRAADVFATPNFVPSVGIAIRSFADEVNREDKNNMLHLHPEDFDMYLLGTYDDSTAVFSCIGPPRQIAIGKDMVRQLQ